jgi:hypothetical protein
LIQSLPSRPSSGQYQNTANESIETIKSHLLNENIEILDATGVSNGDIQQLLYATLHSKNLVVKDLKVKKIYYHPINGKINKVKIQLVF